MTSTHSGEPQNTSNAPAARPIPKRCFGRDAVELPNLGLGGQSLIQRCPDSDRAVGMIARALNLGVRYIDTAPMYGESERRIGRAIQGRRTEAFLATKTAYRRGGSARRSLERSLTRLGTDYVDLMQLHCLMHTSEIGVALGKGGVVPMLEKAREEGLVRRIGITGHYEPGVLSALLRAYPFDSVLMPVNPADPRSHSFMASTLPAARETGASVIAMKVMGAGYLTHHGQNAGELLTYSLSAPVAVAIVSCRSIRDLEENVETAVAFSAMRPSDMRLLETSNAGMMEGCNRIYKRHGGGHGLKIAIRNRLAAEAAKMLPGWWHL